jgi:DNA-binding CsgD family transcriptional regulator
MALSLASAMEFAAFVARGVWDPGGMTAAHALEQEQWVRRALVMPGGSPIARSKALISAAWSTLLRDRTEASALSEEALAIGRAHGDAFVTASAAAVRGLAALHDGDVALARPYLLEALSGFRSLGQPGRQAWVLCDLAATETRKAVDEGGDPASLARAAAYYEEALTYFQNIGQARGISRAQHGIAYIAYKQRDLPRALESTREILARDWEQRAPVLHFLEDIADIAGRIGRPDVAVRLYGAAEAQRERIGRPIHSLYREEYEREVAISRQALSESAFTAGWTAGRALSLEEVVGEALSPFERDSPSAGPQSGLTPREIEVLRLLVAGKSDSEIAETLFISRRTAEGHVRGLCRKLGARTRAAAVSAALASKLVDPPSPPQDSSRPPG